MIPRVRFKGFNDSWEEDILGNLVRKYKVSNKYIHNKKLLSLSYGKIVQKDIEAKKGLLPSSFDTYQIIKEDIIVFRVTDLQNDKKSLRVAISTQEGIITPAYVCVECDVNKVRPLYLFTLLHYYDTITKVYYKMGDGLRQTLSYNDLKDLKLTLPCFSEQENISSIFQSLDFLIQKESKKLYSLKQIKAASLQSMFPQEGETTPRIRFKGFEGEWKKVKLSSIAKRVTRKNTNLETTLPVTISAADGIVEQTSFFNNVVASSNLSGYYLIEKGEFAYNKSYSNGYPYGAVKRMERYDKGALSILYIVFKIDETIFSDYLLYFFETTLWHSEIGKRASEGARNHGLLNIGAEVFLDIDIMMPKDTEQQKIANYFKTLDRQITLQTRRLEKLKQIKAACLDKMFV